MDGHRSATSMTPMGGHKSGAAINSMTRAAMRRTAHMRTAHMRTAHMRTAHMRTAHMRTAHMRTAQRRRPGARPPYRVSVKIMVRVKIGVTEL